MAMFDDPKKELKRLEDQLLKDDEWLDRELAAARALIGDAPAKKSVSGRPADESIRGSADMQNKAARVVVRKTDDYDLDAKPVREKKAKKKKKKSNKGLVLLACLETAGILGVVAYWLLILL